MKESEIAHYLASRPNRMAIICQSCGRPYGNHRGFICPDGIGRFDPIVDEDYKPDPNTIFKYRYK